MGKLIFAVLIISSIIVVCGCESVSPIKNKKRAYSCVHWEWKEEGSVIKPIKLSLENCPSCKADDE